MDAKTRKDIKRAADYIIKGLKAAGADILVYHATSGSYYIKVDCGSAGTIRISDHVPKKHLKYKWNLIKGLDRQCMSGMEIYPFKMIDQMVDDIKQRRLQKMADQGDLYKRYMKQNEFDHRFDKKGFWASCKRV